MPPILLLTWILETVFSIFGDKLISLFTDQDSPIICSLSEFLLKRIFNILFVQKNKNLVKQIKIKQFGSKLKEELLVLFQCICNND